MTVLLYQLGLMSIPLNVSAGRLIRLSVQPTTVHGKWTPVQSKLQVNHPNLREQIRINKEIT